MNLGVLQPIKFEALQLESDNVKFEDSRLMEMMTEYQEKVAKGEGRKRLALRQILLKPDTPVLSYRNFRIDQKKKTKIK